MKKKRKIKITVLLLSLLVIGICVANATGTLAWLKDTPEPKVNPFYATDISTLIIDGYSSEKGVYKTITVMHEMPLEMFVRVRLVPEWYSASGVSADIPKLAVYMGEENNKSVYAGGDYYLETTVNDRPSSWFEIDGVYYYKYAIGKDVTTGNLVKSFVKVTSKPGYNMQIFAIASFIQATQTDYIEEVWPDVEVYFNGEYDVLRRKTP